MKPDTSLRRPRNDPAQYDDLAELWWEPSGPFAMLHWIAKARAALVPHATAAGQMLLDVGCGAGLLAPWVEPKGYHHLGIDVTTSALRLAGAHRVEVLRGDAASLPLADESVDVVCAGELLEHVRDHAQVVDELCRVLRPRGLVVVDTIARGALARLLAVTIAERIPGGAPPGLHDPDLFVDRKALVQRFAGNGVALALRGLRPALGGSIAWLRGKTDRVEMLPSMWAAVLFQGYGRKGSS